MFMIVIIVAVSVRHKINSFLCLLV